MVKIHMSTYHKQQYKNIFIYMNDNEDSNPTFCPICGFAMRNVEDRFSYSNYKCCNSCENKWVYKDIESWKKGILPNKDELESYINEKLNIELNSSIKI